MGYIENPKTKGSGIVCCIPQTGVCPSKCKDCFYQSGRSYLEPLKENLPNMPTLDEVGDRVVRVNDGHDSNHNRSLVINETEKYPRRFYNTSIPNALDEFGAPVVLTVNPGMMTDDSFHKIEIPPPNLMFVRVRINVWNMYKVVDPVVDWYALEREIPVVLTFMAYHEKARKSIDIRGYYTYRKRTKNSYWAIKTSMWLEIMHKYASIPIVYSCGQEGISSACKMCGNCLREYYNTMERLAV